MDKIVIDTNVIFSGLRSNKGIAYRLLSLIPKDVFKLQLSVPLILEYESVLLNHLGILNMTPEDINNFLDFVCKVGDETSIYYLWRPILKDPFDDHILEVAVASNCKYIITYNCKDFKSANSFGISVVTPKEYLLKKELL